MWHRRVCSSMRMRSGGCARPSAPEPARLAPARPSASRAGSGSGRCGTSDSQVPGGPREASRRRRRQEQHRPPDSLRCEGTPHERNGAKADQDDTSANARACKEAQVAVLPWRDYALPAGSRGRCPPPVQAFASSVVIECVHRGDSRWLWCPATPATYQGDITLIGCRQEGRRPGALASGFDRLCSVRLIGAGQLGLGHCQPLRYVQDRCRLPRNGEIPAGRGPCLSGASRPSKRSAPYREATVRRLALAGAGAGSSSPQRSALRLIRRMSGVSSEGPSEASPGSILPTGLRASYGTASSRCCRTTGHRSMKLPSSSGTAARR